MPNYRPPTKEVKFPPTINDIVPNLCKTGCDLLKSMLLFDPIKRITANVSYSVM